MRHRELIIEPTQTTMQLALEERLVNNNNKADVVVKQRWAASID